MNRIYLNCFSHISGRTGSIEIILLEGKAERRIAREKYPLRSIDRCQWREQDNSF